MQYMMNDPESLDGEFGFEKAESDVYPLEKDGYTVVSTVTFKVPNTELSHKERMTLTVKKQNDGKFLVEELKHTGGNE